MFVNILLVLVASVFSSRRPILGLVWVGEKTFMVDFLSG